MSAWTLEGRIMEDYDQDDWTLLWTVTSGPQPDHDGFEVEVVDAAACRGAEAAGERVVKAWDAWLNDSDREDSDTTYLALGRAIRALERQLSDAPRKERNS